MAKALDASGIVCNFNRVPFDPRPAMNPSGIRIGTPAITSRGFAADEMVQLAEWMDRVAQVRADDALTWTVARVPIARSLAKCAPCAIALRRPVCSTMETVAPSVSSRSNHREIL